MVFSILYLAALNFPKVVPCVPITRLKIFASDNMLSCEARDNSVTGTIVDKCGGRVVVVSALVLWPVTFTRVYNTTISSAFYSFLVVTVLVQPVGPFTVLTGIHRVGTFKDSFITLDRDLLKRVKF